MNADIEKVISEINDLKIEIEAKEQLLEKTEALKTTNVLLIEEEKSLKLLKRYKCRYKHKSKYLKIY